MPSSPRKWLNRAQALQISFGLLCCLQLQAATVTLDFESLTDLETVQSQFPGLTFQNAIALTAGLSLNEFEFPPHSGNLVISDDGGPTTILFASPVLSVSGYFTYLTPVTLTAFDAGNQQVAQAASAFNSNLACLSGPPCLGDVGSSPNELIGLASLGGISSIVISGGQAGASFTLDALAFEETASVAVPELPSIILITSALGLLLALKAEYHIHL